jgi:aquaporin-4
MRRTVSAPDDKMRWLSVDEVGTIVFWKALAAEFLGTGILVFVGCGAAVTSDQSQSTDAFVTRVALTFGLTVATMVWSVAGVSGGHINPAVTLAFLITRKITLLRGLLYVLAQCLGAMTGAAFLAASLTAKLREGSFGCTLFQDITSMQAILIEGLITFVLVFAIFATCERKENAFNASKPGDLNGSGSLAIGIAVLICNLAAVSLFYQTALTRVLCCSIMRQFIRITNSPPFCSNVKCPPIDQSSYSISLPRSIYNM